jgi:Methyltransferase domain
LQLAALFRDQVKTRIKKKFPWLTPVYGYLYWNIILRPRWRRLGPAAVFSEHFQTNSWEGAESVSGRGSSLAATRVLRAALPVLLRQYAVRTLLDIPCGDGHWMKQVELDIDLCIGADIVAELVERNRRERGETPHQKFLQLDLTRGPLPRVDLVLCRDCLPHLSFAHARQAIAAIKSSGSQYLLTTTYGGFGPNRDAVTGEWRPLNLQAPPFGFPAPLTVVDEGAVDPLGFRDKGMALWRVCDLPDLP